MFYETKIVIKPGSKLPTIPEQLEDFLKMLKGPTAITITGQDTTRCRMVCTLLHGNEPSGAFALRRWLSQWQQGKVDQPATNLILLIANVQAALEPPILTQRQLPNLEDLNRCFNSPPPSPAGQLAQSILDLINNSNPETIVDLHNTSGPGPAFAITTVLDHPHQILASFFTNQLIITHLRLGALMELGESFTPTLTVECGGADDHRSHEVAYKGLLNYFQSKSTLIHSGNVSEAHQLLYVYDNPLRLSLKPGGYISYGDITQVCTGDLMLPEDIRGLNDNPSPKGSKIAKLGRKGLQALSATDHRGLERLYEYFIKDEDDFLTTAQDLQLFMVTHRADIAISDCVFYFSPLAHKITF